jgi:deoxycytidylate deaminase
LLSTVEDANCWNRLVNRNIKQVVADAYYENAHKLPDRVRRQLSVDALAQIFMHMVVPAIEMLRDSDVEGQDG